MSKKANLLSDGIWVASFQILAALGHLAGIRLLTDNLTPQTFGTAYLLLGVVALLAGGIANPTMQALLRYYPEYAIIGRGHVVRVLARKQIIRLLLWLSPAILVLGISGIGMGWLPWSNLALIGGLAIMEMLRVQKLAVLNASRRQRAYGIWTSAEAWLRPGLAVVLIATVDASVPTVLTAFLLASAIVYAAMNRFVRESQQQLQRQPNEAGLQRRMWRYTLPLLPLGMLGWVTGMVDRYLIGAMMSPAHVGLYVALYGLVSRPMLMLGSVVELTIRPAYQQSLLDNDTSKSRHYLAKWAILIVLGCTTAIIIAFVGHGVMARLCLGEDYRQISSLIPWLAMGYIPLLLSHITTRICYAHGKTKDVLAIEASGAAAALGIGALLIHHAGISGAVMAVPLYFTIQLLMSLQRAWPLIRQQRLID